MLIDLAIFGPMLLVLLRSLKHTFEVRLKGKIFKQRDGTS
jgi:hypothetical protein